MSEKRYQSVLMSTDDLESLKKYQKKYGVNVLMDVSSLPTPSVSLGSDSSEEMTKLREDHEKLKEEFKHLESAFARLLDTLNVILNKVESRIENNYYATSQDYEYTPSDVSKKDYFTNV